jgi:hypothetical protein
MKKIGVHVLRSIDDNLNLEENEQILDIPETRDAYKFLDLLQTTYSISYTEEKDALNLNLNNYSKCDNHFFNKKINEIYNLDLINNYINIDKFINDFKKKYKSINIFFSYLKRKFKVIYYEHLRENKPMDEINEIEKNLYSLDNLAKLSAEISKYIYTDQLKKSFKKLDKSEYQIDYDKLYYYLRDNVHYQDNHSFVITCKPIE